MTAPDTMVHSAQRPDSAKALEVELSLNVDQALRHYDACLALCRTQLKLSHDDMPFYRLERDQTRPVEHAWSWMCDHIGVKLTAIRGFLSSRQTVPSHLALGSDASTVDQATARANRAANFRKELEEPLLKNDNDTVPLFKAIEQHIANAPSHNPDLDPATSNRLRMQARSETGKIQVSLGAIAGTLEKIEALYDSQAKQLAAQTAQPQSRQSFR